MGFPEINIIFKSAASNTVKRGNKGIVFAILNDLIAAKGVYEMASAADIPATLSTNNKNQLKISWFLFFEKFYRVLIQQSST